MLPVIALKRKLTAPYLTTAALISSGCAKVSSAARRSRSFGVKSAGRYSGISIELSPQGYGASLSNTGPVPRARKAVAIALLPDETSIPPLQSPGSKGSGLTENEGLSGDTS